MAAIPHLMYGQGQDAEELVQQSYAAAADATGGAAFSETAAKLIEAAVKASEKLRFLLLLLNQMEIL